MTRDEYRRNAVECMCLAAQIEDPKDKLQLLLMARAWLKLADYGFIFDDLARVAAATQAEAPREELARVAAATQAEAPREDLARVAAATQAEAPREE